MLVQYLPWIAFASVACIMLVSLMRRKQGQLHGVLTENVESQMEWLKKKTRATRIIKAAAKHKEKEEAAFRESQAASLARAEQALAESEPESATEPDSEPQPVG